MSIKVEIKCSAKCGLFKKLIGVHWKMKTFLDCGLWSTCVTVFFLLSDSKLNNIRTRRKRLNDRYQEVIVDPLALRRWNVLSPLLLEHHSVLGSDAVLHRSPLWLPVPFVTAARIAHSHWSSYHSAIFHISHIRSPYLSSSAWARHAKLIQASQYVRRIQWPKITAVWNTYRFHMLFCVCL